MPDVLDAYETYKRTDAEALAMRARARAALGLSVVEELEKGTPQIQISKKLGVVVEQIRRYREAYQEWARDASWPGSAERLALIPLAFAACLLKPRPRQRRMPLIVGDKPAVPPAA